MISYRPQDPFPQDGFIISEQHPTEDSYEGLKLLVLGQFSAERYQASGDEVCISITTNTDFGYGSDPVKVSPAFMDVLRLQFDDTAVDQVGNETATSIKPEQAAQVVAFVKANQHRKKLVIHCFAGMSRSRSMAAIIADYLDLPYDFTILNRHVYNTVLDAFMDADETLTR